MKFLWGDIPRKCLILIKLKKNVTQMKRNQYQMRIGNYELSYQIRRGGEHYILFLHGLGCSKETFQEAFDSAYFSEKYTLLAIDFLGHGDSSKPDNFSYKLEEQSDLIFELLQNLNPKYLNIVAHR